MNKFQELLEKILVLKSDYESGQVKITVPGVMTLIMAGGMDSLFDHALTVKDRLVAIEQFKKAMGSKASLPKTKTTGIGMAFITDEFSRSLWMCNVNPLFSFKICDYYKDAIESMEFVPTGTPNLRFRKEKTDLGGPVDIFGSLNSLFDPRTLNIYSSKNMLRQPAIVAIYKGYATQNWSGGKFRKLTIDDGASEMTAVCWPSRQTGDFDKKLENAMKNYKGLPCLFVGKVGMNRGFRSFTISDIIPFA